ncbi:MAG: DUF5312 domain-containing protein [Treponema sp.]|jgi:hypothetical protein|nr:DUF5312 domain-containing protein [Treponema sp.]
MPGSDTLERLATRLSLEERHEFLEKLKAQSSMSGEPLYAAWAEEKGADSGLEGQYARLPWYYRLLYLVLSFFKNKPPKALFQDGRIEKLGREIAAGYPRLFNNQRNQLLNGFYDFLETLKTDVRFFFDALDVSVNKDRGSFYAFLASLEMQDIHRRLEAETAPEYLNGKNPRKPDAEVRQFALHAMEAILSGISEDQRRLMYFNARSLFCLKELASFLYDRVLGAFGNDPRGKGMACSIFVVKDMLGTLNNILFSLSSPPNITLLESLFVFILQERSAGPDFDMDQEIRNLLGRAENALETIRDFNKQIPLILLLRYASRDIGLCPKAISGGEDWFAVYRDYWRHRIEEQFAAYAQSRRRQEMLKLFDRFFGGVELLMVKNALSETNPNGMPLPGVFALSFLLTFHEVVFMTRINTVLQSILAEGVFFKRENYTDFSAAYGDLLKLAEDIKNLDIKLDPGGEYGKRYALAKQDMSSLPVKRRKIQMALDDASGELGRILVRAREAMKLLISLLAGIVKREPEAKYDSLSNFEDIQAQEPDFINRLVSVIQLFHDTLDLLANIDLMENTGAKQPGCP